MTNRHLNYNVLIPTQSVDGDGITGSALSLGNPESDEIVALVIAGAVANIDKVFVVIEESYDQTIWARLVTFNVLTAANASEQRRFRRSGRFLRVTVTVEHQEVDPADATIVLTVVLLR